MKRKNKIFNVIVSLVLGVLTVFGLFACNKAPASEVGPEEQAEQSIIQSVTLDEAPELTATRGVAQKTVTATVLPNDAPNRTLSWELFWLSNPFGENVSVSSYITIFDVSQDTLTCTIKALQGFDGAIIGLKASSNVGNVTAVCRIEYDGMPDIDRWLYNNVAIDQGSGDFEVVAGSTKTVKWAPTNTIGQVGSKYCKKENVTITEIKGWGSFTVEKTVYNHTNGTYTTTDETLSANNYVEYFLFADFDANGNIVIEANSSVSGYYRYTAGANGDYVERNYKSGAENVNFSITVTDSVSGFVGTLYITITPSVTRVTLNPVTITF